MTATEYVVLVDEEDREIGTAPKLVAHEQCLRHRAFSIFIFQDHLDGKLLLQQRAFHKYHCPGLWSNTCCSHPRPGEDIQTAATRRLEEEFGITTSLTHRGRFHYIAHFSNQLSENEVDHVFVGILSASVEIKPNPTEIQDYRWVLRSELTTEIKHHPSKFTPWLAQALTFT